MSKRIDIKDLEHILDHTCHLWDELRGQNVFITGGTGFFGCWLLESFTFACDALGLGSKITVLSRDPEAFAGKAPHLAGHPAVNLIRGDVRTFEFPAGEFPLVIHAAATAAPQVQREDPLLLLDTIVGGTRRTLEFARTHGTRKFLLTSSGAIYGRQPAGLARIPEDYPGSYDPMDPNSDYGGSKRTAEMLCRVYANNYGIEAKIARCFAFIGPYLSLDARFAVSDFIRDIDNGDPIHIEGDGTAHRSYLYAADLAIWLWTILLKGQSCRPYNVGSDKSISIAGLADKVRRLTDPPAAVIVSKRGCRSLSPQRYVPSTERARKELGLEIRVSLEEAIRKYYDFIK